MPKPNGEQLQLWCRNWDKATHDEKVAMATESGITYESARHWRSDSGLPKQVEEKLTYSWQTSSETKPVSLTTTTGVYQTAAIIGDPHIPEHDSETLTNVEEFLYEQQPDYLFYNGDMMDFYQVSVFDKDPARLGTMQNDLDETTSMFDRHSDGLPQTKKVFVGGTHENRWFKYLRQHAPALANLKSTNVEELYKLKEHDITYVPFEVGVLVNKTFLILHGDIVSKHSSYTAKMQSDNHGGSGICNHTHRMGSYYKRNVFGFYGWWENGCLCKLNPDWLKNPNWMQGFSLVHFKDDRYWVEQIPIINHKFMYGGKVYGN